MFATKKKKARNTFAEESAFLTFFKLRLVITTRRKMYPRVLGKIWKKKICTGYTTCDYDDHDIPDLFDVDDPYGRDRFIINACHRSWLDHSRNRMYLEYF